MWSRRALPAMAVLGLALAGFCTCQPGVPDRAGGRHHADRLASLPAADAQLAVLTANAGQNIALRYESQRRQASDPRTADWQVNGVAQTQNTESETGSTVRDYRRAQGARGPTPSTKARQWCWPCRPRDSTGVAPGRVHCGTGRLVGPQVATPSASERQYQQIGEPCPPTGESA
jgi:hypothetical protein